MKQQVKRIFVAASFGLFVSAAYAQSDSSFIAPWVSDKGYWVLESNIHDPMNNIIRFYNNENVLVYTEHLSGVKLDTNKKKVKMKLKKALEKTLLLCEEHKEPGAISVYVAAILK
jgi:hypothetical protein